MAATVNWDIKLYDLAGNPYTIDYTDYDDAGGTTELARHAYNRSIALVLNGVDQLSFSLRLSDPAAYQIRRLKTIVKLFRSVVDPDRGVTVLDTTPFFCGIVGTTNKAGESNEMQITAFNPLWRLQFHFHILNHYLEINPDTSLAWTQSELIWKLIDLVNGAFGAASYTGIDKGIFEWGLPDEPQVSPYFVAMGSNTWSNIFDDIMKRPASVDLFPVYMHTNGDPTLMELNTMEHRGLDKSATVKFNYHTGANDNCDDMQEESSVQPGQFANYLWAVGKGGPNSGKKAVVSNPSGLSGSDGYAEVGIHMAYVDRAEVEILSMLPPIADAELATKKHPQDAYTVTISPAGLLYYDYDFVLGDVVALNANRGALQVDNIKQRIYAVTLSMSDNNLETSEVLLANDFYGSVAPDTGGGGGGSGSISTPQVYVSGSPYQTETLSAVIL